MATKQELEQQLEELDSKYQEAHNKFRALIDKESRLDSAFMALTSSLIEKSTTLVNELGHEGMMGLHGLRNFLNEGIQAQITENQAIIKATNDTEWSAARARTIVTLGKLNDEFSINLERSEISKEEVEESVVLFAGRCSEIKSIVMKLEELSEKTLPELGKERIEWLDSEVRPLRRQMNELHKTLKQMEQEGESMDKAD